MENKYRVSVSPHVRDSITTNKIMLYVILALLPSAIFGVVNFGLHALTIICVSIIFAVGSEFCLNKLLNKASTIGDLSAVVTGLILAMNMPAEIAWWIPALGSVFAIVVIKGLFGGLGKNFMNPALGARCFLTIAFSSQMTTYASPSGFTPLAYLKQGYQFDLESLFIGNVGGVIGETSALALLLGAAFLLVMQVIDWKIPVVYLGSFAILVFITASLRGYDGAFMFTLEELCAGGIIFGAFFMATDYVTSPITPNGKIIFGLFLGVMTWLFRMVGSGNEGVSYAIILGNCLTPMIEAYTRPRAFGIVKEKAKKEAKA